MGLATQYAGKSIEAITATISSGQSISSAVPLYGATAIGFQLPVSFSGTSITFLGSMDKGVTFKEVRDATNTPIAYTVSASGSYELNANTFVPYDQIQLVSNATEGADTEILVKPYAV